MSDRSGRGGPRPCAGIGSRRSQASARAGRQRHYLWALDRPRLRRVADAIRLRSENPQADCDPYLEPAIAALLRGFWRGRVRALHAAGALSDVRAWAPYLRLPLTLAAELAREASFGTLWSLLGPQSPTLQRSVNHLIVIINQCSSGTGIVIPRARFTHWPTTTNEQRAQS